MSCPPVITAAAAPRGGGGVDVPHCGVRARSSTRDPRHLCDAAVSVRDHMLDDDAAAAFVAEAVALFRA
eukprot:gene9188-55588_t